MVKIAIISALGRELKEIKVNIKITNSIEIKGYRFSEGFYNNLEIVLATSSVGKVNAALCTEILINNFAPEIVINTGIAGSLNNKLNVLDIVVSESIIFHDIDEYILKGCFPYMESYPTELNLLKRAQKASDSWQKNNLIYFGKIISGDSFISSNTKKEKLINLFNPLCVEMEGGGIAQACYINKIPLISFRGISDKADDSARDEYENNELLAANEAGKFVLEFLKTYNN